MTASRQFGEIAGGLTPHVLAARIESVDRALEMADLTLPLEIARYRASLETYLRGDGPPPGRWEYGPVETRDLLRQVDECNAAVSAAAPFALRSTVESHLHHERELLLGVGDDAAYSAYCLTVHGLPTPETIAEAHQILEHPVAADADQRVDAHTVCERIRRGLDGYGLAHWRVEASDRMAARVSVSRAHHRVRVRLDARFTDSEVVRLVVHEVGGHVLRSHNAEVQAEPLSPHALGSTVPTEEGLAAWLETWAGADSSRVIRTYAARVVAVDLAQKAGLIEVAEALTDYVSISQAAEIATRVKRGLRDPHGAGGLTKDHGYLSGLFAITAIIRQQGYSVLPLLFATKWPLSELPLVRSLVGAGLMVPATTLPDSERLGLRDDLGPRSLSELLAAVEMEN